MAWSCWKDLWICIKWTFWWQPFILGPKMYPMMVHDFCTRPIAYIHIDRWLDPSVFRCRRDVRWFGCQVQPVAGAPNGPNGLAQASHSRWGMDHGWFGTKHHALFSCGSCPRDSKEVASWESDLSPKSSKSVKIEEPWTSLNPYWALLLKNLLLGIAQPFFVWTRFSSGPDPLWGGLLGLNCLRRSTGSRCHFRGLVGG